VPDFGKVSPVRVGRDELLDLHERRLLHGPGDPYYTWALIGERRVGKTVCLTLLGNRIRERGLRGPPVTAFQQALAQIGERAARTIVGLLITVDEAQALGDNLQALAAVMQMVTNRQQHPMAWALAGTRELSELLPELAARGPRGVAIELANGHGVTRQGRHGRRRSYCTQAASRADATQRASEVKELRAVGAVVHLGGRRREGAG
jgi:hypothetical protein